MVTRLLVRLTDSSQRSAVSSAISAVPGVTVLSPGSFGFVGRPTSPSTIMMTIGGVVLTIGGLGLFLNHRKMKKIDRWEEMFRRRRAGNGPS